MAELGVQDRSRCAFLVRLGLQWGCQLYLGAGADAQRIKESLAIGAGCSSPLFNTDREAVKKAIERRGGDSEAVCGPR